MTALRGRCEPPAPMRAAELESLNHGWSGLVPLDGKPMDVPEPSA
jgi:hypothetical protein